MLELKSDEKTMFFRVFDPFDRSFWRVGGVKMGAKMTFFAFFVIFPGVPPGTRNFDRSFWRVKLPEVYRKSAVFDGFCHFFMFSPPEGVILCSITHKKRLSSRNGPRFLLLAH